MTLTLQEQSQLMKLTMNKFFFILIFFFLSLQANEAKQIDLYYANGMDGDSKEIEDRTWEEYVETLIYINQNLDKNIPDRQCIHFPIIHYSDKI